MKKRIIVKSNGEIKKVIDFTLPDKEHLQAQIKYPHKIYRNKKAYNRKRDRSIPND